MANLGIETKRRAVKGLTTMIENLTRQQKEFESQIAELEAQLRQCDSSKADIARDIQSLQDKLFDAREKLSEKVAKLQEAEDELESLRDEYDSQTDLLNDIINYDKQIAGYLHQHVSIMLKAAILDQILHDTTKICRKILKQQQWQKTLSLMAATSSVGKMCLQRAFVSFWMVSMVLPA